jgi:hypothetical protein
MYFYHRRWIQPTVQVHKDLRRTQEALITNLGRRRRAIKRLAVLMNSIYEDWFQQQPYSQFVRFNLGTVA